MKETNEKICCTLCRTYSENLDTIWKNFLIKDIIFHPETLFRRAYVIVYVYVPKNKEKLWLSLQ